MRNSDDNFWGEEIFRYSRTQAISDGVLVDLTSSTDDKGQLLWQRAEVRVQLPPGRTGARPQGFVVLPPIKHPVLRNPDHVPKDRHIPAFVGFEPLVIAGGGY